MLNSDDANAVNLAADFSIFRQIADSEKDIAILRYPKNGKYARRRSEYMQNRNVGLNFGTLAGHPIVNHAEVRLAVYDPPGCDTHTLIDIYTRAGARSLPFDATYLPSSFYFYSLRAGDYL